MLARLQHEAQADHAVVEAEAAVDQIAELLYGAQLVVEGLVQDVREQFEEQSGGTAAHANPDETNSAVEVYLQVGVDGRPSTLLLELLAHILDQPFYHQLRTVEQLGYLVHCGLRFDHGVVGLRFMLQSSEHDAAFLEARVQAFLETVPALLRALPPADFRQHRAALVAQKLEKDTSLAEEAARHWAQVEAATIPLALPLPPPSTIP
eukprot:Transcript_5831.p2 GENE.Transcript_5831~~Transcript_5831.p2  ORF type:complete len:207 (-),score=76.91 Transcript_5831:860-1480(-)